MNNASVGEGPKSVSGTLAPRITTAYKAYDEGRLSTAETLLLKYTNDHPEFTDAWFKLGNIYYRTGQYPAAITAYENVIQQDNKHGKAWYNLALTRIRQAEETLMAGEVKFEPGDERRLRLTSLKKKIRSGVRQYKPKKQ
jgi:TolA-binding protein